MKTGKKTLLMKNKEEGTIPSNYRPIICFPTFFKLSTAIVAESMLNNLKNNGLISDEQMSNRRKSRGTKGQFLIDKMISRNAERRKTKSTCRIDRLQKAFDSLPHSWIVKAFNCSVSAITTDSF